MPIDLTRWLMILTLALASSRLYAADEPPILNPIASLPQRLAPIPYQRADLDAGSRAVLERLAGSTGPAAMFLPPVQLRSGFAAFYRAVGLPEVHAAETQDRDIDGPNGAVPVRIYRPRGARGLLPTLVYYHGGGMSIGSIESYDTICQLIAAESGAAVVSVGYRLAPEHRFPAGVEDSYAALVWVAAHGREAGLDPGRIAVGGDSAGGYLTAVITQLARDRRGPSLRYQILIYPAVGTLGHSRSLDLFAKGYYFGRDDLAWTYAEYIEDAASFSDPMVQPILAKDFSNLPPAFMITAGNDILRDDAEEYLALMRKAGVPVALHRYPHTIHAFLSMAAAIPDGRAAISEVAAKLKAAFDPMGR